MKNVCIQIPYDLEEIDRARDGLDSLYEWLSNSIVDVMDDDLFALDVSIDVLAKVFKQLSWEE